MWGSIFWNYRIGRFWDRSWEQCLYVWSLQGTTSAKSNYCHCFSSLVIVIFVQQFLTLEGFLYVMSFSLFNQCLKLLRLSNLFKVASASESVGITGVSHDTRPGLVLNDWLSSSLLVVFSCLFVYLIIFDWMRVSSYCCDKSPQNLWFKTTQVYYLTVLEARSPKWVSRATFFLETLEKTVSLPFPASRGCLLSSACSPTLLQSLLSLSYLLLSCFHYHASELMPSVCW